MLVCTSMYWYVLVCTSMFQYERVHAGMNWYELVCTDIYLLVTVYSSMYKYTHSPVSMTQYILVCTSMYQYILVHTSIYSNFLLTNAVFPVTRYIMIHHGTRQYNEVPKSPVYLDYDGTTRQKAVQSLVP